MRISDWSSDVCSSDLNILYVCAQVGVGLYMFLVGTTLRLDNFQSKAKSAMGVSAAGIIAPFLFAALITPFLLDVPGLITEGLSQGRSEGHTSEIQSLMRTPQAVFCLNKKKNTKDQNK